MAITVDVFSGLLAFVFGNAALAKLLRQKHLTLPVLTPPRAAATEPESARGA
jgi:hypothetical protein